MCQGEDIMYKFRLVAALSTMVLVCALLCAGCAVRDSGLTRARAVYANQPPDAPADVLDRLAVVGVRYFGFDGRLHRGQVVVHEALAKDVAQAFEVIRKTRFPVASVIPIAHPAIQEKGPYGLSPDTDNTSGYAWRPGVNLGKVSLHGLGLAVDINPRLNPYIKGDMVLPPGASYDPARPGTLTPLSPVVLAFKRLGWEWGGDWAGKGKLDYMHFQKIPPGLKEWAGKYGR